MRHDLPNAPDDAFDVGVGARNHHTYLVCVDLTWRLAKLGTMRKPDFLLSINLYGPFANQLRASRRGPTFLEPKWLTWCPCRVAARTGGTLGSVCESNFDEAIIAFMDSILGPCPPQIIMNSTKNKRL